MEGRTLRAGLQQIAPVLLSRERTLAKVERAIDEAAAAGCEFVCFGECLVPGYPVWLSRTAASRFDDPEQKRWHARYLAEAVDLEAGHLDGVRAAARRSGVTVVLGVYERPRDRGGHSGYCSRVFVGADGRVRSVHRKLVPTYEERLAWAPGDGHGLQVHEVGPFRVGSLLCWENWMPLARAALQAEGENVHVSLWPGSVRNTQDLTRVIARESRSYHLAVCGLLRAEDLPADLEGRAALLEDGEPLLDGGTAVAGPDGEWIVTPRRGEEELVVVDLDLSRVYEERQNFDPAGHYSRPDVLRLFLDRTRQTTLVQTTRASTENETASELSRRRSDPDRAS